MLGRGGWLDGWMRASKCGARKAASGGIIHSPSSDCLESGSLIDALTCHLSCPASLSPSISTLVAVETINHCNMCK